MKSVLFFIDSELAKKDHLIGELDRATYLGFLETDYYQRVQEEYKGE